MSGSCGIECGCSPFKLRFTLGAGLGLGVGGIIIMAFSGTWVLYVLGGVLALGGAALIDYSRYFHENCAASF